MSSGAGDGCPPAERARGAGGSSGASAGPGAGSEGFITVDEAGARARAAELDMAADHQARCTACRWPSRILTRTRGLRTTFGSLYHADHVPGRMIRWWRACGRLAQSSSARPNTPNSVRAHLRQRTARAEPLTPHDLRLTSAVHPAVLCGGGGERDGGAGPWHGFRGQPCARRPASAASSPFAPAVGVIADPERELGWTALATHGAMARTVADAALLLRAMAAPSPLDPLSWQTREDAPAIRIRRHGPILASLRYQRPCVGASLGLWAPCARCWVTSRRHRPTAAARPKAFRTLRAAQIARGLAALADDADARISPTVRWNVEAGRGLSAQDYLAAEAARTALWRRFVDFFQHHDVLVAPAASVLPWPNADGEVTEMDGRPLATSLIISRSLSSCRWWVFRWSRSPRPAGRARCLSDFSSSVGRVRKRRSLRWRSGWKATLASAGARRMCQHVVRASLALSKRQIEHLALEQAVVGALMCRRIMLRAPSASRSRMAAKMEACSSRTPARSPDGPSSERP